MGCSASPTGLGRERALHRECRVAEKVQLPNARVRWEREYSLSENEQANKRLAHSGAQSDPSPAEEKPISELDFEAALAHLESIVGRLEQGQVGLTESLDQYEQGVKYLKQCYRLLEQAEKRVEILSGTNEDGTPQTEPFADSDAESLSEKADNRSQRRSAPHRKTPKPKKRSGDGNVDAPRGLF